MDNKVLNYLLKNDSNEVLSKSGIKLRKIISPLFRKIMMLFTSGKLEVIRKSDIPKDKKIIYAGTHGFHDDIIFSMKTINKHVYLLYGSLLDFFKSFHGLGLWVNGVILVDRKDKKSRKSSIEKMQKALEYGADIVMFPEGTWNKNESMPVQKLYPGIYEVAEKSGALVVPIATTLYDDKCYSIQGDAYDITNIDDKMSLEIIKKQLEKIIKVRDLLIYSKNGEDYIKKLLNYLLITLTGTKVEDATINEIKSCYPNYVSTIIEIVKIVNNCDIEELNNADKIKLIDNISSVLLKLDDEIENIRKQEDFEEESIYDSILIRSRNLLKTASEQKKITAVSYLRDKMCTLKWELYKKGNRNEFYPNYWNNYIDSLIKTTKGLYDHEIEDVAEYKDPDEVSKDEVFSVFNNIEITKENSKILSFIKK